MYIYSYFWVIHAVLAIYMVYYVVYYKIEAIKD